MAVRKFNPTTPGQRHKIIGTFGAITTNVPEKSLVFGKASTGGRNHVGKMTMRYLGGGHKRKFRVIDFKREKDGIPATVKTIEYDPNRSARIALLFYADGEKRYILAPNGLEVGQVLLSGAEAAYTANVYDKAYDGFVDATKQFTAIYDDVFVRRAAAEEAIRRAKQKVTASAALAEEADEIAPLQDETTNETLGEGDEL